MVPLVISQDSLSILHCNKMEHYKRNSFSQIEIFNILPVKFRTGGVGGDGQNEKEK